MAITTTYTGMSGLGKLGQIGVKDKAATTATSKSAGTPGSDRAPTQSEIGSQNWGGGGGGGGGGGKGYPSGGDPYSGIGSLIQGGSRNEYGIVGGILSNFGLKYGQPKKTGGERLQEEQAKMLRWKRKMKEKYIGPPAAVASNLGMSGALSLIPGVGPGLAAANTGMFLAKEIGPYIKKYGPKIG